LPLFPRASHRHLVAATDLTRRAKSRETGIQGKPRTSDRTESELILWTMHCRLRRERSRASTRFSVGRILATPKVLISLAPAASQRDRWRPDLFDYRENWSAQLA